MHPAIGAAREFLLSVVYLWLVAAWVLYPWGRG